MNKKIIALLSLIAVLIISLYSVSAVTADYCCQKTTYGAWCQNAPQEKCDPKFPSAPTSCDATSYCKGGCCYDSTEGLCMENTPQKVCSDKNGTWADSAECAIPQCELGCCVLDNQAAFVSLTRCKKLSGFYGLDTDFRLDVGSEIDCIAIAQSKDRGACVYEEEFIRTCKFTTREECLKISSTGNLSKPEFYKDYLCSAEELSTNCGRSKYTICVAGKDGVYFEDTCGNPANIYDASKANEPAYWKKIINIESSCGYGSSNVNSKTCGNCDYFLGSLCKSSKRTSSPQIGNYICSDLNCYDTSDGKDHRHGESWCSHDGNTGQGRDSVGSRDIRHICVAGEELLEPCADFRQKVCVESITDTGNGVFVEAQCIVNRWQDCASQEEQDDCENTDKRDCHWLEGASFLRADESNSNQPGGIGGAVLGGEGVCLPDVPPGLKFWEGGDSEGVCSIGNAQCIVEYEKGLFESKKPVKNKECLEDSWGQKMNEVCTSIGDCGGYVNWLGKYTSDGFDWKIASNKKSLSKGIVDSLKSKAGV